MPKTPEKYLIDSLALFHQDPADTEYQEGYFDALAYMADYFGVIRINSEGAPKPTRPQLVLIQGGLSTNRS